MKPHAVIEVRPDKFARVCAWCPDKVAADAWCESRGYDVSHTLCGECAEKQKQEIDKLRCEKVTPPVVGFQSEEEILKILNHE